MTERIATCRCGALTATCAGEPARISICHCLACKRRTGSAFSWNATYAETQVRTAGPAASYERPGDSGHINRYHFCPTCGATAFYTVGLRPGMVSIPVGAFADPDFPPPTVEVYAERRCLWIAQIATEE